MKAKLEALGLLVTEIDNMLLDCYGPLYLLEKAKEMLEDAGYCDDRAMCLLLGVEPATETRFSRLMVCPPEYFDGAGGYLAIA